IGWRDQCLERFAVRSAPVILAGLGLPVVNAEQWKYFTAVRRRMRLMLETLVEGQPSEFGHYIRPPDELSVAQWADAYRVLSTRASAEPGPYRTSRTPYLRAIMDDLGANSPVQKIVFKKAAQIGASESGNCWLGSLVDQAPGPI